MARRRRVSVLIDTSAVVATMVGRDPVHRAALAQFETLIGAGEELVTHGHAVAETVAVLQRLGGLPAVHDYATGIEPSLNVVWVDEHLHRRGLAALLAGSRRVSLVDWISFDLMREREIDTAFAFDGDFEIHGFRVIPG